MKKILLTLGLLSTTIVMYGQTFMTRTGKISFNATTPGSPEKIEGINNEVANIIDTKTGNIVFQLPVKSFKFERELMQEHFNENYMESDKFPKAQLDMVIVENLDFTKDGTYDITLKGTLEMHGVKKDREIKGKLTIKNGQPVSATAEFMVKLADHGIKIPSIVGANIAEDVKTNIEFAFEKFHK